MKKWKLAIVVLLGLIMVAFAGVTYLTGQEVFNGVTHLTSQEETLENEKYYQEGYENLIAPLEPESASLSSSQGDYDIPYLYLENDQAKGIVVMVHGLGGTKKTLAPIMRTFYDMGYSVISYDQANSGQSQVNYNTFGVLESYDTLDVLTFAQEEVADRPVVLWGESYGGATAVMAAARDQEGSQMIDYLILDCPLADSNEMIDQVFHMVEDETGIPVSYLKWSGDLFNRVKLNVRFADMDASEWAKQITIPVFITNADQDQITPPHMAQEIYQAIPHDQKYLKTMQGYGHCEFTYSEPEAYQEMLADFLQDV